YAAADALVERLTDLPFADEPSAHAAFGMCRDLLEVVRGLEQRLGEARGGVVRLAGFVDAFEAERLREASDRLRRLDASAATVAGLRARLQTAGRRAVEAKAAHSRALEALGADRHTLQEALVTRTGELKAARVRLEARETALAARDLELRLRDEKLSAAASD